MTCRKTRVIDIVMVISVLLFPASILFAWAMPKTITETQAAQAIYGEAGGEDYTGKLAVACAIRNRGTLRGVVAATKVPIQQIPRDAWIECLMAWHQSAKKDITRGATHWESTDFKTPTWAYTMMETFRHGKHVFYKTIK